jgi:oligosaccharide repeat unit polymerase
MAWAYWDGVGLLLASGLFLGLSIATVGNLLAYSRADFFKGVGDTRGLGVFLMIFPSALALMVLGARRRVGKWVAVIMAFAGFVLVMLSGYRTTAVYPLIIGAIIWTKCKRRIPLPLVAGGILIVVLGLSFVGVLRQLGPYDSLNEKTVKTSLDQTSVKDTVLLGQTGGLLAHVLRLVPREDPYRYGMTYLVGLIDAIPNIGLQIGKSKRAEVKNTVAIGYDKFQTLPPSDWLTYRVAPWAFDLGQGVGFTTIGEAYLNFGTIGVIGFFALVGFLLGKLDQIDLLHHPDWFVFASAFLWHFVRTVRDDLSNFTKPALFTLIILAIWRISRKFWLFRIR